MPPPIVEQQTSAEGKHARPAEFPWPPVLFLAVVVGGWVLNLYWPMAWPGLNDVPAKAIGFGFILLGFGIAGWALMTMLRGRAQVRPDREATVLITDGPFRRFRNPMYVGYVLLLLGLSDTMQNIWIAILVPVFVLALTRLAILPEERHLEEKFGDAYRQYKSTSRRWI
jgi:protein-S-isoprenylcysteine O-methyltransferase Ste14